MPFLRRHAWLGVQITPQQGNATGGTRSVAQRSGTSLLVLLVLAALLAGTSIVLLLARSPQPLLSGAAPTPTPTPAVLVWISPTTQNVEAGTDAVVEVRVDNVADLGAYEFHLTFDTSVLAYFSITESETFLESTERTALCVGPDFSDLADGIVSFGCGSTGTADGPSGSGVLAKVTFTSCASSSNLAFVPLVDTGSLVEPVSLSNTEVDTAIVDIPTRIQDGSVTVIGGGPCPTPTPTATPTTTPSPTLTQTPTDGPSPAPMQTSTAGPSPTSTQTSTAGPSPTPMETPTAGPSPTEGPSSTPTLTPVGGVTPTAPTPTPLPSDLGDVNGDHLIDSVDALWLLWYLAALLDEVPNPGSMDVNADDVVNPVDATLILQLDAGLVSSLPPGAAGGGWAAALRPSPGGILRIGLFWTLGEV